ncbi:hypothetical protein J7432_20940 [Xanthomonas axonopodis pv. begoniae]|nr:hypothetical protein [Xanthomonas axonopodis pv. begoniae]MBO9773793.1 hypothetical protein [Xanthomonas axonopodis pv. begoniae]
MEDLQGLIKKHLKSRWNIRSPLEASAKLAAKSTEALNQVGRRLDEESLTAAFFGGLAASLPMCVWAFPMDKERDYAWMKYDKAAGDMPESKSGADFCLALKWSEKKVRLAIFQAKSDWSNSYSKNKLNFSQSREENGKKILQLERLVETASLIGSPSDSGKSATEKMSWVHYLCQFERGLSCVPLSKIATQVNNILSGKEVSKSVDVTNEISLGFSEVIRDGFALSPKYWRNVDFETIEQLPGAVRLRELGELMNVFVGDDGSGGWSPVEELRGPEVISKQSTITTASLAKSSSQKSNASVSARSKKPIKIDVK